jgi:hemolysin activation/secretion protein
VWAACSGQGWSQTLPSSADPARKPLTPQTNTDFSDIQQNAQGAPRAQGPMLSPETAGIKFHLNSVSFSGAGAFSEAEFGKVYTHLLGRDITLAQLTEIMVAIQQMYYDAGYTLSKVMIPEQNIQSGDIRFEVIEGYAAEVDVDSSLIPADILESFKSSVLSMRPLNTKRLERLMLLLNDRPGLNVSSILSTVENPGAHDRGAVKLSLKSNLNLRRNNNFVEFNNHGSNFTGAGQMVAGAGIDNALPNYSNLFATYTQTTSARELRQASLTYDLPVAGISGTLLHFISGLTFTEPGGNLDDIDIKGKSEVFGFSVSYPLIRQRDKNWDVEAGFDYKNTKTDILDDRLSEDRIRSLVLKTKYSFSDNFKGINVADVKYSQGFDILNARKTGSEDLSREEGQSDYKKIEASYARLQSVTDHVDILATARGQYTNDPLLSSEEFGHGGGFLGRGYDPSEIAGDRGVSFSLEARYKNVLRIVNRPLQYQLYGFYDFGKVWNIDPSAKGHVSAASAGVGTRFFLSDQYSMDLNFAVPLTKSADNPPKYADKDGPRVLLSVKYNF